MSHKGGRYSEMHKAQQQTYYSFEQDTIHFHKPETEDNYDPEKLMQCPYDNNHKIRACRFPYHLVKCRKNHPDIVQQLVTCPFNARHQVPRGQISQHISSCDDKSCIEQDIASECDSRRREVNAVSSWQSPPCEEDWDRDLVDQSKSVFIWGTSHRGVNSPVSSTTMGHKNCLASGLRAPRSLPHLPPWKNNAGN